MPRGDRTGPMGLGPMTGRGLGYCSGFPYPGYMNPAFPGGFYGRGGRGRGYRHWFYATGLPGWMRAGFVYPNYGAFPYPYFTEISPKEEIDILRKQAEILKNQLKEIEEQISILGKTKEKEK